MANYARELRSTLAFPKTTIQGRFSGLDSFADHGECRISEANGRVAIMTGADSGVGRDLWCRCWPSTHFRGKTLRSVRK